MLRSLRVLVWLFLFVGAAAPRALWADELERIETVEDLWRGFDPEALPLDIEIIKSWDEGPAHFQSLRFTGEAVDGQKVRVFAMWGAPAEGQQLPGILHVHGGGQTASLDWVRFWASRGYVCVTFDFCGRMEGRTDVTDWGPIKQGNMLDAGGGFQLSPTPRESSWFHWTLVSRRALTLLASHRQVDSSRLGVFGISVGGTLTWMIAGSDTRVKCGAPIYGCGYNYDRRNARWQILVANSTYDTFQRFVSPEAHAPYITCPLLFLSATNDGHGLMDRAAEALGATRGPTWQVFSPRTDHHIEPREGRDLPLWMDWHLKGGTAWPKTPTLRLAIDDKGVPQAAIGGCDVDEVAEANLYYALGDKRPPTRFWRRSDAARSGSEYLATAPVMDTWDDVYAFANVTFKSGVCLSTALVHAIPAQLGKARATLAWQANLEQGPGGIDHLKFHGAYTDPSVDWMHLRIDRDEHAGQTIGFNPDLGDPLPFQLYTHILGDPQFQGPAGALLAFQIKGEFAEPGLTLSVIEQDRSLQMRTYSAVLKPEELGSAWREITLPLVRFTDKDGRAPSGWNVLDKLEMRGLAKRDRQPQLARLRWVVPAAPPQK